MSRKFTLYGRSESGRKRLENQDRFVITCLADAVLLAVADGMGGAQGGGLASDEAVRFLESRVDGSRFDPQGLERLAREAGERIAAIALQAGLEGMGTTLTAALLVDGQVVWVHAGDSRLYLIREGKLQQVSTDHRFLQDLIDSGDVSPEEVKSHPLRNVLDQCLGCPGLAPDCGAFMLQAGDMIILTTDGIHDYVDYDAMLILLRAAQDLSIIAENLIESALLAGSGDDLSVVLCRVAD